MEWGWQCTLTWYLVSNVLHTPVNSIMPTRTGMTALLDAMVAVSSVEYTESWREVERTGGVRRSHGLGVKEGGFIDKVRRGLTERCLPFPERRPVRGVRAYLSYTHANNYFPRSVQYTFKRIDTSPWTLAGLM